MSAAFPGLDRIIAAGAGLVPDSFLARELRIVRADLELAKAALERGDVVLREREAAARDHLTVALSSLRSLGVGEPTAEDVERARGTVAS